MTCQMASSQMTSYAFDVIIPSCQILNIWRLAGLTALNAYKLKSIGSLHNQNNEQSWLTDGKCTEKKSEGVWMTSSN